MKDSSGQDDQVVFLDQDADPMIQTIADIEEALAVEDVSNLLVFMQMLHEEHLDLGVVVGAHALGGDDDLVAVLVGALRRNGIDRRERRTPMVENAKVGEVVLADGASGIVFLALVAWSIIVPICFHFRGSVELLNGTEMVEVVCSVFVIDSLDILTARLFC